MLSPVQRPSAPTTFAKCRAVGNMVCAGIAGRKPMRSQTSEAARFSYHGL